MVDFGIALDVDGVLVRGKQPLSGGSETIARLRKHDIPFVLLTNGGKNVSGKAEVLSESLGSKILPSDMIVSHSPLAEMDLMNKFSGSLLVVSQSVECIDQVVKHYGWDPSRILKVQHLRSTCPLLSPLSLSPSQEKFPIEEEFIQGKSRVDAVVMLQEPRDWAEGFQIILDVLLGQGQLSPRVHLNPDFVQIPLYVANPDFDYQAAHSVPRLTSGAAIECLKALYERELQGKLKLEVTWMGKPTRITSSLAEKRLNHPKRIFAVGDNPKSDVRGASLAGDHWTSVLVCTGCYRPPPECSDGLGNDPDDPAHHVCENITEAIDWIFSQTNL
mmetsp:Transcript_32256/g.44278  ORF Transcript_32256/g.44278 Transcript_32256/m.44278 type:complete len:331 (+) Transcript_32256:75-1067(+)|eukprot:CAMPEP_0201478796 /NCGR_PEP_ID=MMETSP0151_2-20130828/3570_1 /ASSEMBLY_ACC=CAM_ASM_000257 /TAXON_ID=200890 /ORGANISM="Paramoeba atlantica, Strain 621/1 / CCAP 1560/9" /LENGTH=330 /DNA_ID=CAMNT_0047859999 /DNA_START=75 /DNA_END=1067 /DNA_ORIENTATION=+